MGKKLKNNMKKQKDLILPEKKANKKIEKLDKLIILRMCLTMLIDREIIV